MPSAQLATLQVPDPVAALPGLLDVLAGVTDPRARRGVRHQLVTILAVSICAVTAGERSLVAIAEWADSRRAGCPKASTISYGGPRADGVVFYSCPPGEPCAPRWTPSPASPAARSSTRT
jgi:hypothetical protein